METNETSNTQQSGDARITEESFNQQSLQESSHQATIEAGTDLTDSPYVRNDQPVSLESSMMTSDMQSIKAHCEYSHRILQRQVQELKNAVELELRKRENDREANLLRANVTKLEQRLTALQRMTAQQTDRSLAMKKEFGDNDTANKRSFADINLKFEQIIGEISELKRKQTEHERKTESNNGNTAQSQYAPESLSQMIDAFERQLGMYDVRIADMDQRFQEQCKTEHTDMRTELSVLHQQLQGITSLPHAYKTLTSSLGNNEKKILALQKTLARQSDVTRFLTFNVGKSNEENKIAVLRLEQKVKEVSKETTELKRRQWEFETKIASTSGSREQHMDAGNERNRIWNQPREINPISTYCRAEHYNLHQEMGVLRRDFTRVQSAFNPLTSSVRKNEKKVLALQKTAARQIDVSRSLTDDIRKNYDENKRVEFRLQQLERKTEPTSAQLSQMIEQFERQLGMFDVSIADMDQRFQVLENTNYTGVMVWKIHKYCWRKKAAESDGKLSLYSQPFYSSRYGYKMCARVYLNGNGIGKGTHMSLFLVVMKGEYDALLPWPFRQKVTLMLLDQGMDRRHLSVRYEPDPTSSSFKRPTSHMNIASGCPLFVAHSVIEGSSYVSDDTVFLRIHVDGNGINELG